MAMCIEEAGADNTSEVPLKPCTTSPSLQDTTLIPDRLDPLLHSHPTVAYVYIAIVSTALLVGTGGNFLILMAIGAMRNLQRTGKTFIINMALADLCVAAIADPMCLVAAIKGEGFFDDKKWLCETVAAMCLTACFCAFLSLTLASINRYIFICHNHFYDKVFTTKTCVAACIVVWLSAFLLEFPNFLGWGGHFFDPKNHQCIWDRTASLSYTLFVSLALIFFPLVTMLICYILIFRHIYRTKLNLYQFYDTDQPRARKIWIETLRTSRMLMGIFIVFLICWTPYGFVVVFDFYQKLSVEVHLFVTLLAHLHSAANCTVYAATNNNFRTVVLRRFGNMTCGLVKSPTSESESKSTEMAKISHIRTIAHSSTAGTAIAHTNSNESGFANSLSE